MPARKKPRVVVVVGGKPLFVHPDVRVNGDKQSAQTVAEFIDRDDGKGWIAVVGGLVRTGAISAVLDTDAARAHFTELYELT